MGGDLAWNWKSNDLPGEPKVNSPPPLLGGVVGGCEPKRKPDVFGVAVLLLPKMEIGDETAFSLGFAEKLKLKPAFSLTGVTWFCKKIIIAM